MYWMTYCSTLSVGDIVGVSGSVCKMLKMFIIRYLCDGQGADRGAILHTDRSCLFFFSENYRGPSL